MKKRESPTKSLEKEKNPDVEHAYVKTTGYNPTDVSLDSTDIGVRSNREKIKETLNERGRNSYTHIHTHPVDKEIDMAWPTSPSAGDLDGFMYNKQRKTMMIAEPDSKTGEISGYLVLRKTKKTPIDTDFNLVKDLDAYERKGVFEDPGLFRRLLRAITKKTYSIPYDAEKEKFLKKRKMADIPEASNEALKDFCKKYNLQYRYAPVKGYEFRENTGFIRKPSKLELKMAAVFIAGITLIISFLLLNNLTGFSISSNISQEKLNLFLIILFVLAIIGILINPINKKNKKRLSE